MEDAQELSRSVVRLVNRLVGAVPEAIGKDVPGGMAGQLGDLVNQANDTQTAIQSAFRALERLDQVIPSRD
jgi:hypothetical protein